MPITVVGWGGGVTAGEGNVRGEEKGQSNGPAGGIEFDESPM